MAIGEIFSYASRKRFYYFKGLCIKILDTNALIHKATASIRVPSVPFRVITLPDVRNTDTHWPSQFTAISYCCSGQLFHSVTDGTKQVKNSNEYWLMPIDLMQNTYLPNAQTKNFGMAKAQVATLWVPPTISRYCISAGRV